MTYQHTTILIRPDISSEFFTFTPSVQAYVKATYEDTGKVQNVYTISPDGLSKELQKTWIDHETSLQFATDPALQEEFARRDAYMVERGHTYQSFPTP